MNKEEIEKALANIDETIIEPTYYVSKQYGIMFCTYDNIGCVFEYWLQPAYKAARRKMLSGNMLHDAHECAQLFFRDCEVENV